jgi:arylsulfatase A-like enzyme
MRHRTLVVLGLVGLLAAAVLYSRRTRPPTPARSELPASLIHLEPTNGRQAELLGDGASTKMRAIVADLPSVLSWRVTVPTGARLETFLSFARGGPEDLGALTCRARIEADDSRGATAVLLEREVRPAPAWEAYEADLSAHAGDGVELRLRLDCPGLDRTLARAARWSVPVLSTRRAGAERSVLLVSVDTLRADHLGVYGYPRPTSPRIDALAASGLVFENAETVQSATWPALTSLHTSLYPSAHGVLWNGHKAPEGLVTLAELLHAKHFSTSAFITNMTRGRHPGFSRLFLSREGTQAEADRAAVAQAVAQLERERDRRFFMWVHLLSPHADYAPPAPRDTAFTRKDASRVRGEIDELAGLRRRGVVLGEADVSHVVGLYDGEVAFVDEQVGRLLDALREHDLEKSTLVVFTADHGEDLYEHNRYFFHSPSIYGSSMRIPLVLSLPGSLPGNVRTDQPASLVDVGPTVLGLLGLPIPRVLQGENLLPGGALPAAPVRTAVFGETNGRIVSMRTPEWRFVYNPEQLQPDAPGGPYPIAEAELYDQKNDPQEKRNLAAERPDLVRALTAQVLAFRDRTRRKDLKAPGLDPEALEELRALGYLSN